MVVMVAGVCLKRGKQPLAYDEAFMFPVLVLGFSAVTLCDAKQEI